MADYSEEKTYTVVVQYHGLADATELQKAQVEEFIVRTIKELGVMIGTAHGNVMTVTKQT